jgi:hypothetical protein
MIEIVCLLVLNTLISILSYFQATMGCQVESPNVIKRRNDDFVDQLFIENNIKLEERGGG